MNPCIADLLFEWIIITALALNVLDAVAHFTINGGEATFELAIACTARSLAQGLWLLLFAH